MKGPIIICSIGILLAIFLIGSIVHKRENFTQGYDYLISGCIKKCELDLLRKNPYFVQLQEGGRMTQNYCRMMCASEYNKHNPPTGFPNGGACRLRKPPYYKCPHLKCRYFGCR